MTPLGAKLIRQITATGPMTVADYMAACLLDPDHGYYATRDPFGAAGDFTTAPEISQMFGELVGLALAQAWLDQGRPERFVLAELGPGRGTLLADALRVTRAVPGFAEAAKVHTVEASATLRTVQRQTLKDYRVNWVDQIADLPQGPLYLIGNEFFDALPIRQFERARAGWAERMVTVADDRLAWGLAPVTARAELSHRLEGTQPGQIVETCAAAQPIIAEAAARIEEAGGLALFIDYGGSESLGDTFQALKGHAPVDPLEAAGEADLTAHVDFGALTRTATETAEVQVHLTGQGAFLERLGITPRAQALAKRLSGAALESHIAAHRRLTDPTEMGTLFLAMAVAPRSAQRPPGFG